MLKVILCIISLLYLVSCPAPRVDNITVPPVVEEKPEEDGNPGESGDRQETGKPEVTDHLYTISFMDGNLGENGYSWITGISGGERFTEAHLEGNVLRFKPRASDQYFWVKIDMKDRNTFHATYYKTGWYPGDYDESKFPTQYIVFRRM